MTLRSLLCVSIGLFVLVGLALWFAQQRGAGEQAVVAPIAASAKAEEAGEELERSRARRAEETAPGTLPVEESAAVWEEVPASDGWAALEMRIVDRATGEPVASNVELWQLGVPEDLEWQAGNHLRAEAAVSADGSRVEGLPLGRYRARVFGRVRSAEDPPDFFLAVGENRQTFEIDLPTPERWWLRIVDENGQPLEMCTERASSESTFEQSVSWAVQRRRQGEDDLVGLGGGFGGSYGMRARRTAKEFGFDLGVWHEPDSGRSLTRVPRFDFDGRFDVKARAKGWVCDRFGTRDDDELPQRHFVAVSLPRNYFDTSFCDPSGAPVQREQVQVKVEASLIEVEPGDAVPVDRLHVAVSARWNGGNWTTWGHNLAGGPPSDLHLSPQE